MAKVFNDDAAGETKKDSITVNWTPLTGLDAGGEGIDIVSYTVFYEEIVEVGGIAVVPANNGEASVEGSLSTWTHENIQNAQSW